MAPPARLLTDSEPAAGNKPESLGPYTFQLATLEQEHYCVLGGCKYEGVMTLAACGAHIPLRL